MKHFSLLRENSSPKRQKSLQKKDEIFIKKLTMPVFCLCHSKNGSHKNFRLDGKQKFRQRGSQAFFKGNFPRKTSSI